ncbi:MAG: TIGR01777 family oxidoreductase [Acidothermaceae bacterium]
MRILVAGASGLIGSALVRVARSDGDEVVRLVRRETLPKNSSPDDEKSDDGILWNPGAGEPPDLQSVEPFDAVVNLAGAGIGDHRWSDAYKQKLADSRIASTDLLARTIARLDTKPKVFLSGSAVGYYGDTGDNAVDENSPAGRDFLARLAEDWERAAMPAAEAGIRTVLLRTGIVMSTKGGALGKVLPLFRAGLGGRLGSGRQYISWIARPDYIAALWFLLEADAISGPVNLTAPNPVTNAVYTKEIATAVRRPAIFAAPGVALKAALGEFAESVLGGQRVLPNRLQSAGFEFGYSDLDNALRALIASGS